jgi:drug/metabolite transporter (DMT)-like permease
MESKMLPIGSIIVSMLFGTIGQLFIKRGLNSLVDLDFSKNLFLTYTRIFFSPLIMAGLSVYFCGVFFWLYGLSKVDLSLAYPFVSVSYIFIVIMSWLFLGENISIMRWIGVSTICIGVLLLSRS